MDKVADGVSRWLLDGAVGARLEDALGNQNGDQVRVVFSVGDELAGVLANLPVELLQLQNATVPLALDAKVSGIFHLLSKVGSPQTSPTAPSWPLQVLIVRSNPADLGGAVPPATPLRNAILKLAEPLGDNAVKVDILSSEPDIKSAVTVDALMDRLRTSSYDILIYLGHGDLVPNGTSFISVLQLETPDGTSATRIDARQLAALLYHYPVPVVILTGCLTAVEVDKLSQDFKQGLKGELPVWLRGSVGMAQGLVNSESGVQFAVGMRYLLETESAQLFLEAFFEHLLTNQQATGDIEAAVRSARLELYEKTRYPPSWSAPVVFSTAGAGPRFDFLAMPRQIQTEAFTPELQAVRMAVWGNWVKESASQRSADFTRFAEGTITALEQPVQDSAANQFPLLMPGRMEAQSGQTISLPINLYGQLNIDKLEGRVVISGAGVQIQALRATQAVKDKGYRLLFEDPEGKEAPFLIERMPANSGGPLPAGPLFTATLVLGPGIAVYYALSINLVNIVPNATIRLANNVILVPPP